MKKAKNKGSGGVADPGIRNWLKLKKGFCWSTGQGEEKGGNVWGENPKSFLEGKHGGGCGGPRV